MGETRTGQEELTSPVRRSFRPCPRFRQLERTALSAGKLVSGSIRHVRFELWISHDETLRLRSSAGGSATTSGKKRRCREETSEDHIPGRIDRVSSRSRQSFRLVRRGGHQKRDVSVCDPIMNILSSFPSTTNPRRLKELRHATSQSEVHPLLLPCRLVQTVDATSSLADGVVREKRKGAHFEQSIHVLSLSLRVSETIVLDLREDRKFVSTDSRRDKGRSATDL